MNLEKSGELLCNLRKAKKMTQKQVADRLGVLPKTISKWETGHGFPDISCVPDLAKILGVSTDTILSGSLTANIEEVGNMKKTKFYVCPQCRSFMQGVGECKISCCGKELKPLKAAFGEGDVKITEIENDYYVTFSHEMNKEHFIAFAAYVTFDKVLTVRLYPEQDSSVRFPKLYGGKLYYYCNKHGLFEYVPPENDSNSSKGGLTSLMSAFARAYHGKNSRNPIFYDAFAEKLLTDEEYENILNFISAEKENADDYINKNLVPTPAARAAFLEESIENAIQIGTQQYVILGSGLDTFALKKGSSDIKIFELDKKTTVEDKKKRIERAGLKSGSSILAADLSCDNIEKILCENGFDENKKTIFSCMGLMYYLTKEEIDKLLEQISGICAEGSSLVFDFGDSHLFSSEVPRVKDMVEMAQKSGEPMKSCFGYGELEKLLEKHGFLIYEFLNCDDIQKRFFEGNEETSAFEHINYVLTVKK